MQELAPYLAWARERGNASLESLPARSARPPQCSSRSVRPGARNLSASSRDCRGIWAGRFCPTALGKKASSSTLRATRFGRERSCAPHDEPVGAERVLTLRRSPLSLARCCIGRSGSTRPRNSVELARTWGRRRGCRFSTKRGVRAKLLARAGVERGQRSRAKPSSCGRPTTLRPSRRRPPGASGGLSLSHIGYPMRRRRRALPSSTSADVAMLRRVGARFLAEIDDASLRGGTDTS